MKTMPALFVSHGAPTYALEPGAAGAQLSALGRSLGKPNAIVVVSPHWMTRGLEITASQQPETLYDFGGFPDALYAMQYPAPGDPALAARIQALLLSQGFSARLNPQRGLDHGAWVPLMHLYPDAEVPVIQVSLPVDSDETKAYALGRALSPLAKSGVLIVGSGSITHNLAEYFSGQTQVAPYALEFCAWVQHAIRAGDTAQLLRTLHEAPHARRAHPTTEHFLPLLVAAGASDSPEAVTVLDGGVRHGVLAMESYLFGEELAQEDFA